MQQDGKKLNCEQHPDSELSVIYIGDNPSNVSRFLCIECVLAGGEQYKKQGLSQLIKIKDYFANPGKQYRKTIDDELDANIQEIKKCVEQLLIYFQIFSKSLLSHIEQLKANIKSLMIISASINLEIEKQSNFRSLKELFQIIKQMDTFQGTQEFIKIQEDVNIISKKFPQFYSNAKNSFAARQEQSQQDYKQSLMNIQKDISQLRSINIYSNQQINNFNIENQNDFRFALIKICNFNSNCKIDLIYQGSRDGLTSVNYWQKCDKQSNLFNIITLKNGNIFGGYSPCQLNQSLHAWVGDDTNQSFIFQQNKQEIYQLKKSQFAIFCGSDYGPKFGSDFYLQNDFKTIGSILGSHYDTTGYKIQNTLTHLTGETDIEVVECKVYKITFLK